MLILTKKQSFLFFILIIVNISTLADTKKSVSNYNWNGLYLGGFLGGASSTTTSTTEPTNNIDGTIYSWNEPYNSNYEYQTSASFMGGGTIGYNWQSANLPLLLGIEGEYGYLHLKGHHQDPNAVANEIKYYGTYDAHDGAHSTSIGSQYGYGLIGGRIGYTASRSLFYIKSGAVFTNIQTHFNDYNISGDGAPQLHTSSNKNTAGYAIGGGIEYALPYTWTSNFSVKAEYLYFGFNRTQNSSGICTCDSPNIYSTSDKINGFSTVKLGVNYKF